MCKFYSGFGGVQVTDSHIFVPADMNAFRKPLKAFANEHRSQ